MQQVPNFPVRDKPVLAWQDILIRRFTRNTESITDGAGRQRTGGIPSDEIIPTDKLLEG